VVWVHLAIRSLLGWRSEALRLADVGIVATEVWLLVHLLPALAGRRAARLWAAAALLAFYFGTSEWSHCQRDTWMLLPSLAALYLRRRQVGRLTDPATSAARVAAAAGAEGLLWAAAFWIKPFVAVPALACWLARATLARRGGASAGRLSADAAGLLASGALAGAAGSAWLIARGAWPYFWDFAGRWTREYYVPSNGRTHLESLFWGHFPFWGLVHLAALPIAAVAVYSGLRAPAPAARRSWVLLGALYLGWVAEVLAFQKDWAYAQAPAMLLALTLVAAAAAARRLPSSGGSFPPPSCCWWPSHTRCFDRGGWPPGWRAGGRAAARRCGSGSPWTG
jgi:hypothetical protein